MKRIGKVNGLSYVIIVGAKGKITKTVIKRKSKTIVINTGKPNIILYMKYLSVHVVAVIPEIINQDTHKHTNMSHGWTQCYHVNQTEQSQTITFD